MSFTTLPLRPLIEGMGMPQNLETVESGLVRWTREVEPGRTSMAIIDVSDVGRGRYVLTFDRYEVCNGVRTDEIIFDAVYHPGLDTIDVIDDGPGEPEDLLAAFQRDFDGTHLEAAA
jgi:hypothetical protein